MPNNGTSTLERMTEAARAFVAGLDDGQRALACESLSDAEERRRWYFTPNVRNGVSLLDLSPAQQQLGHRLLASGLSHGAYVTATTIMGLENPLDLQERWGEGGRLGVGNDLRVRDPNRYYFSFFGDPNDDDWAWRFGGHHVCVQYAVAGGQIVSPTPTFFGANPAESPLGGGYTLRPLAGEEDLAHELLQLLPDERRAQAVLSPVAPDDIMQGNRPRVEDGVLPVPAWEMMGTAADAEALARRRARAGLDDASLEASRFTLAAKGLPASAMSEGERDALRALVQQYVARMPADLMEAEYEKIRADFDAIHFAWAGGMERGAGHYYRLQAPRFLVEYDCTQNDANHIHSVWRDPEGDFGGDALAEHYRAAHGG